MRAAYLVTAAWLLAGATADVALIRSDRNPITHVLRTPPGIAFLLVFNLHVADVLGRFDPFRLAGRWIPRRGTC